MRGSPPSRTRRTPAGAPKPTWIACVDRLREQGKPAKAHGQGDLSREILPVMTDATESSLSP